MPASVSTATTAVEHGSLVDQYICVPAPVRYVGDHATGLGDVEAIPHSALSARRWAKGAALAAWRNTNRAAILVIKI